MYSTVQSQFPCPNSKNYISATNQHWCVNTAYLERKVEAKYIWPVTLLQERDLNAVQVELCNTILFRRHLFILILAAELFSIASHI